MLPNNTCPLIKASVGARLDRTCPFFRIADMYIGETTCDGKKKAWEILSEDVPIHVMDLPQMKRAKDVKAWAEEIKELMHVVEEFTGNKVTAEKLAESIKLINNREKRWTDCMPVVRMRSFQSAVRMHWLFLRLHFMMIRQDLHR